MAAEKLKSFDIAAARPRISEWPSEDGLLSLPERLQRADVSDVTVPDTSVLRDMDAVVSFCLH
jgi:hypothetical protein